MRIPMAVLSCLVVLALAGTASATPVGIVGYGSSGTLDATLLSLIWTPDPGALPVPGPPWNGDVNSATSLKFAGCASGVLGSPGCLFAQEGVLVDNGMPLCAGTNTTCPGGATTFPIPTFLQFESRPNLIFELSDVSPGSADNCLVNATVTCSIFLGGVGSPVELTPVGSSGTSLSIGLFGIASDAGVAGLSKPGSSSQWTGEFDATVPNMTPAQITALLCPGGKCNVNTVLKLDSVGGSFAASVGTMRSVPEPGTVSLLMVGLVALTQIRRRRN